MDYLKKYWISAILVVILLASFFLMVLSARQDSLTVDEKVHISAGYLHVWKGDYTFNAEHPPLLNDLAGLFAKIAQPNLPEKPLSSFEWEDQWEYGDLFYYESGNDVEKIIFWARSPIIFLTLGLIYLVFLWGKALFSPKGGLLAAALIAFDPNILAHGHLATTDLGLAFFFVLTLWLLRKYLLRPTWLNASFVGLGLSLTLLAKFSGLVILPIIFLGLIYLFVSKKPWGRNLAQAVFIFFVAAVLFWALYAFSMRGELTAANLFVPVYEKVRAGAQVLQEHQEVGHWNYLNGEIRFEGWWYYFLYVLWYKLPMPTMVLAGLAIIFWTRYKKSFPEEFFVIFPLLIFLGSSFASRIDIGIRHILPVLPFLYIFIGRMAQVKNLLLRLVIGILVLLNIFIGIRAFPNYIAYFNQIAGGTQDGAEHLIDSNLDWNQNMKRFGQYAQINGIKKVYEYCWDWQAFSYYGVEAEFLPTKPVQGVVVICAHQYKIKYDYDFKWVEKYPPDEIFANTLYIWRFDKK